MRRSAPLLVGLFALLAAFAPSASGAVSTPLLWEHGYGGAFRRGAVTVGDLTGDGIPEVVVGGNDGWIRVMDLQGRDVPGWPRPLSLGSSNPTAIDSTPAIVDLDKNGTNELVVTGGSVSAPNQHGGIAAYTRTGKQLWFRHTSDVFNVWTGGGPDGYADSVAASPAIGDTNGDGFPDIVVAGFDHRIYFIDRNGRDLANTPVVTYDTTWSTAALADVDHDGRDEVFLGTDISRNPIVPESYNGGLFERIDIGSAGNVVIKWRRASTEAFYSSAAVGDIDGDGRAEAVVGDANAFNTADSKRVWAFHLDDGSDAPGFTTARRMPGTVLSSPALGDLTGDHVAEVVVTDQAGYVTALRGNGSILWRARPSTSEIIDSPIIADLDGDGTQDVAVGDGAFTYLFRGSNGGLLGRVHENWVHQSSAAVVETSTARMLVSAGFRSGAGADIAAYALPSSTSTAAWPMFHKNAKHTGAKTR